MPMEIRFTGDLECAPNTGDVACDVGCPMCSGEMCRKCGAGCWNSTVTQCAHNGADRHDSAIVGRIRYCAGSEPLARGDGDVSDPIKPALTAGQWAYWSGSAASVRENLRIACDSVSYDLHQDPAALVALANAALPDDDPRKITRAMVVALRASAAAIKDEWPDQTATFGTALALERTAVALESYLPPITPEAIEGQWGDVEGNPIETMLQVLDDIEKYQVPITPPDKE